MAICKLTLMTRISVGSTMTKKSMVVFRNCIFYEKTVSSEKKNSKRDTFELRKLNMPLKITYGFMTQQLFFTSINVFSSKVCHKC